MLNLSKNSLALWQKPLSRYGEFLTDYYVGCTNLRRIYLPLSLKVIGKNPFEGCKSITFINRSINFTVDDNVLFDKNKHTIISFASKKRHYNIPNTVLKIKALTFASCSLDYLNLPASITDIEDEAFFSTSINHINNESIHFTIEDNVLFIVKSK